MENNFSSIEIKQQLSKDLKIDVAFPFFPLGKRTGSAACCVVDTDWIERLACRSPNNIELKSPRYSKTTTEGSSSQKQSPTVNVYVNLLLKSKANSLSVYQSLKKPKDPKKGLSEGKEADQNVEKLNDMFYAYEPIRDGEEGNEEFIKKILNTLWPKCNWFKKTEENKTHIFLERKEFLLNEKSDSCNSNLSDVIAMIETETAYYFLSTYRGTTLQDLLKYNPGVLNSNLKKGFVTYQLMRAIASLHSRGILHGNLKASNVLIDENLWTQVTGIEYEPNPLDFDLKRWIYEKEVAKMTKSIPEEPLVIQWVKGSISNYSYLMALNHLAGRREGDPNFHPILPWITDFSGNTVEEGWRDFKHTKFRINKGDEQLDFTFNGPVPHHITDILSDITYYVYQARRMPIPVLCQFVRSKYEPNEYPSSMQRLYQWTPDECIPEFYTDPTIFKSLHHDMSDLQIPKWADSPEDFIYKHAQALESDYVSAHLHHWIDLTFGYNLTGEGAEEAKNVALPLLAGQNSFMKHGIIQLFKDKHPERGCNWSKGRRNLAHADLTALDGTKRSRTTKHPEAITAQTAGLLPLGTTRTPSVHSTASSIDTGRSLPLSEPLVSALRNEPIRMPLAIIDNYFIEDLEHYENLAGFSNKYKYPVQGLYVNSIYHSVTRYKINPTDNPDDDMSSFSVGTAYDMLCLGQLIHDIHSSNGSNYLEEDEATNVNNEKIDISSNIEKVINALRAENWQDRPSAKSVLSASFPVMGISNLNYPFPFSAAIPDMYEFLAAFHQAEWSRRLYLADKWIDTICDLEDEAFMLILPGFSQLFAHEETRIGSISLFPKLAQRLGLEMTRQHLLKRIISIFEALRPNIPKVLFDPQTIFEFVKRLGITKFLQQMLPCYLEAVTYEDKRTCEMAADSLVHICSLLGPVLTSKHIIRQLVKIVLRDHQDRTLLLRAMVRIIGEFGTTFTAVQYAYLISLVDSYRDKVNLRNSRAICSIIALLEDLLPYMQKEEVTTELKSGFVSTIYLLLEPLPIETGEKTPEDELKMRLTLSMKSINYLLKVTEKLTIQDWSSTIVPILQKYFSGFSKLTTEDQVVGKNENTFDLQKNYQMMYAYHNFCSIVSKEKMNQMIPTSEIIETTMHKKFSSDNKQQVPTVSQSTPKVNHKTSSSSLDRSESSQGSSILLSWMNPNKRALIENQKCPDLSTDTVQWKLNINEEKLYECSTNNLFDFGLRQNSPVSIASPEEPISPPESQKIKFDSLKPNEKTKVSTSVLPWKTKWKPSPEDLKNWNRFLSTNSEEMSKSMQFSFNDLKLRGFAGHTGAVRGFAVNEPSKVFASASRDKTVKIWSLNVHQDIEQWQIDPYSESKITYTGHRKGLIHDIHFLSSTQETVASCDGNLHLWNPETGTVLHQFTSTRSFLASVKPVFHSRHLVGGTVDGHLTFYDAHNHTAMQTWKSNVSITGLVRVIAVNPSERLIAVAFSTGTISLIESRTGTLVASWKGAESEITSLRFYTDDILLSCAPADHVLYCWNASRLALVKTIPTSQDITSFDIYKDEIITINSNNSVSFIPINDDFQAYSSKFKSSIIKSQVSTFGIVNTDQLLLFGCTEGEIFLYA